MDPHLEKLQFELASAVEGLPFEQMSWHPPGKWSVAEIIEHLYLTYTGTMKGFSRVLEAGKPKVSFPTWKQRAALLLVLGTGRMPSGREAPSMSRPRGLSAEKVRGEIAVKIAEMDALLATCEARFGAQTRVLDHLILGPLTIAQWRKFHLVHGRHHIRQIQSLRRTAPSS
jgi:Protein of unknown function (DUF1569)